MKITIEFEASIDGLWQPGDENALRNAIFHVLPGGFLIEEDRCIVLLDSLEIKIEVDE